MAVFVCDLCNSLNYSGDYPDGNVLQCEECGSTELSPDLHSVGCTHPNSVVNAFNPTQRICTHCSDVVNP